MPEKNLQERLAAFTHELRIPRQPKREREKVAQSFPEMVSTLPNKFTFDQLQTGMFYRGENASGVVNTAENVYLLLCDQVPTAQIMEETPMPQYREVKVMNGRVHITGLNVSFDPEKLIVGCLTSEPTSRGFEIAYPHLDDTGKIHAKTVLVFQPETQRQAVLAAMEEFVSKHPVNRVIPNVLSTEQYAWLSRRWLQVDEIVRHLGLEAQFGNALDSSPYGAILHAAWEPTAQKSIDGFKEVYRILSNPPYDVIFNYIEGLETHLKQKYKKD